MTNVKIDLNLAAKRNIYADENDKKEDDNMDDWDEEKLMDVVSKKHGAEKTNQTEIVRVSVQNLFYLRFSKKL